MQPEDLADNRQSWAKLAAVICVVSVLLVGGTFLTKLQAQRESEPQLFVEEEGNVGLPLSGSILFTNTGTPAVGMQVECFTPGWKKRIGTAITDTSGHFSFRILPEGRYFLKATKHDVMTIRATLNLTKKSKNRVQLIAEAIACEAGLDNSGVSRQEYLDSCK